MTEDASTTAPDEAPVTTGDATTSPAGAAAGPSASPAPPPAPTPATEAYRPNYVFLAVVSIVSLGLDLATKFWAKTRLEAATSYADRHIEVVASHLSLTFAKNRGGAWGLFQDQPESIRRPFFLAISVLAIGFIVSLYRKLTPRQWALRWGLPLVLGGALGNLINRIQFNYVVDFIDYRASWVKWINGLLTDHPTDHWPTFNIADVAIVTGVILMAIDMFTPTPKRTVAVVAPTASPAKPADGPTPPTEPASPEAAPLETSALGEAPKPASEDPAALPDSRAHAES